MEKEKNVIFEAFARKAAERIEERKKLRTNTAECGEDPCGGRHVETAL